MTWQEEAWQIARARIDVVTRLLNEQVFGRRPVPGMFLRYDDEPLRLRPLSEAAVHGIQEPDPPTLEHQTATAGLSVSADWCAPSPQIYELSHLRWELPETFSADGLFPDFAVSRGGIQYGGGAVAPVQPLRPTYTPRPFAVAGQVWAAFRDEGYEGHRLLGLGADRADAVAIAEDEHARYEAQFRFNHHDLAWETEDASEVWQEGWAGGTRYYVARQDVTTIKQDTEQDTEQDNGEDNTR